MYTSIYVYITYAGAHARMMRSSRYVMSPRKPRLSSIEHDGVLYENAMDLQLATRNCVWICVPAN
jgi:hypothetical protein